MRSTQNSINQGHEQYLVGEIFIICVAVWIITLIYHNFKLLFLNFHSFARIVHDNVVTSEDQQI
jgi:hypothetical protein